MSELYVGRWLAAHQITILSSSRFRHAWHAHWHGATRIEGFRRTNETGSQGPLVTTERGSGKKLAGVGSLVFVWTFFDGLILGIPILFAAVFIDQRVVVFAVGVALWTVINVAACGWIQRERDAWIVGTRFETRLEQLRNSSRACRSDRVDHASALRSCSLSRPS